MLFRAGLGASAHYYRCSGSFRAQDPLQLPCVLLCLESEARGDAGVLLRIREAGSVKGLSQVVLRELESSQVPLDSSDPRKSCIKAACEAHRSTLA